MECVHINHISKELNVCINWDDHTEDLWRVAELFVLFNAPHPTKTFYKCLKAKAFKHYSILQEYILKIMYVKRRQTLAQKMTDSLDLFETVGNISSL